jgi:putative spermidine/putrescine transport system ATP-binding protein
VALARALVNRPRVLLLDEPLGALDLKLREQMQIELKAIQRELGITFLFVTHDQDEALTLCDRLAVMRDGRLEQVGGAAEVYERPRTRFVAEFVGTSNLLTGAAARTLLGHERAAAVRPEKVRLARGDARPGEICADGVVQEIVYAGAQTRVVVSADAGAVLTALLLNSGVEVRLPERFERVTLAWPRSAVHELES